MGEEMKRGSYCFLYIALAMAAIMLSNCNRREANMVDNPTTPEDGGCSTYASYEGSARILRIAQTSTSVTQAKVIGGPGYEGYEVWFHFVPKTDVSDDRIEPIVSREHLFTLHNGWYVGPLYLERYRIQKGNSYPCILKVIEKGTGNPVVFNFPTIDTADYFESRNE